MRGNLGSLRKGPLSIAVRSVGLGARLRGMESGLSLFSICGLGDLLHPLCSAKDSTGYNNSSFPVRNKIAAECPSPRKPAWNLRFSDPTCVDTCYQR